MGGLFEYCMYNEAYIDGELIPDPKHPDRDMPAPTRWVKSLSVAGALVLLFLSIYCPPIVNYKYASHKIRKDL